MLFNSYTFILFFAGVLALHYLPLSWRFKKFNLLIASYVFYAAWNPPFVALLWISTLADWWIARRLPAARLVIARRALLAASLGVNLGLLGFFKYGQFMLDNLITLLAAMGIAYQPAAPDIILPVGISFYTFQTLSYTLDIYRRQADPWHSFLDYALYVTFFPQLVAGPIMRAHDFLPQCNQPTRANGPQFGWGLSLLVLGMFQKIVLADGILAPVVEAVYDRDGSVSMLTAWSGSVAFAGQIFCDFAGYSTCAIGVAMCLGFSVPDNFRCPYGAVGFSDFWRRWHISLSTWLRDYLYIPLGGNRKGPARTQLNLMTTMLLGGLWHGASWTFIVWGGLHGLYLMAERVVRWRWAHVPFWHCRPAQAGLALITFILVCFTWVFFRADSFERAFSMTAAMVGLVPGRMYLGLTTDTFAAVCVVMGALLAVHWLLRNMTLEQAAERCPWWIRSVALALMLIAIVTMPGDDRAFIYFQF